MASNQQVDLPRSQLPSWTRPSLIGHQKHKTGTLIKDSEDESKLPLSMQLCRSVSLRDVPMKNEAAAQERIAQLEKSISFLRVQHSDTLKQLHEEIKRLKTENKELNFKLVMCRCGQRPDRPCMSRSAQRDSSGRESCNYDAEDELRPFLLEEEVRDLRSALQNEQRRSSRLISVIEERMQKNDSKDSNGYKDEADNLTLSEYRSIIHKLNGINKQQSHELLQLKADLQDLLFSDKWTPDSYLLAKSYISSDQQEVPISKKTVLPNIKKQTRSKHEQTYHRVQEAVRLPSLRNRLPPTHGDRYRRTLSLQRGKLGFMMPGHL